MSADMLDRQQPLSSRLAIVRSLFPYASNFALGPLALCFEAPVLALVSRGLAIFIVLRYFRGLIGCPLIVGLVVQMVIAIAFLVRNIQLIH